MTARRFRAFALLVALGLCIVTVGCTRPPDILTSKPPSGDEYYYVSLSKDDAKGFERTVARRKIVARHTARRGRAAYVIEDETRKGLGQSSLRLLDQAQLKVELYRVSDINGWGVDGNGEIHMVGGYEREFDTKTMGTAFSTLQALATTPFAAVKKHEPKELAELTDLDRLDVFEVGFVVKMRYRLVAGNPLDPEDLVVLYEGDAKTRYYRTNPNP